MFAYYGLPSLKVKEPVELPIDIIEDTPINSKTSLKLVKTKVKEVKKVNFLSRLFKSINYLIWGDV